MSALIQSTYGLRAATVTARQLGVPENGTSDCYATLQAALNRGMRIWLTRNVTYRVSRRLDFADNSGLMSDGSATIYAPAASFNNVTLANRYATNSAVLNLSGQTANPYTPRVGVVLSGIKIVSEVSGGRLVDGIVCRNVIEPRIECVEVSGFPVGCGIRASSVTGGRFSRNYIHDFTDNTDWTAQAGQNPQLTGIELDNDRVNGVASSRLTICENDILNMTVGATFIAAHGYQTDGITLEVGTQQVAVADNVINNVGEAIDCWGSNCAITGNTIRHSYTFGIKLVHGAAYNTVVGNSIYDSGLAGIAVEGSSVDTIDTAYNLIDANVIAGIDGAGVWAAATTGCILVSDGGGTTFIARNNVFSNNTLNPGPGGKYCIVRSASTDTSNSFPNTRFISAGSIGYVSDNASSMGRITATNRTLMRANSSAAQTINASSAAKIALGNRAFDDRNEFDNVTTYRWVCQIPGLYRVIGQVTLGTVAGAGKIGLLEIRQNGGVATASHALMTSTASYSVDDLILAKTGDYIELWYTNGDTANVTANNGPTNTFLTIQQA